jgi:hypothetical protein
MRNDVKWWLRRYFFYLTVLVALWIPAQLVILFFGVPLSAYLHFGGDVAWHLPPPEHMFKYWLTPVVMGLIVGTVMVAHEWYLNTFGHPVKKAIYAILFCAVVWVFVFAVLIPWGRDMVPHLVNWWHGL